MADDSDPNLGASGGIGLPPTPATPGAPPAVDETPKAAAVATAAANAVNVTARAKRRREEAVRRLVADVQARHDRKLGGADGTTPVESSLGSSKESQDWVIASTVAVALERGLDRDLHHELVQEGRNRV